MMNAKARDLLFIVIYNIKSTVRLSLNIIYKNDQMLRL